MAQLEPLARVGSRLPAWLRTAGQRGLGRRLLGWLGFVDAPAPQAGLAVGLRDRGLVAFDASKVEALSDDDRKRAFIIVPDVFTSYFEPEVLLAAVDVTRKMGFLPFVAQR